MNALCVHGMTLCSRSLRSSFCTSKRSFHTSKILYIRRNNRTSRISNPHSPSTSNDFDIQVKPGNSVKVENFDNVDDDTYRMMAEIDNLLELDPKSFLKELHTNKSLMNAWKATNEEPDPESVPSWAQEQDDSKEQDDTTKMIPKDRLLKLLTPEIEHKQQKFKQKTKLDIPLDKPVKKKNAKQISIRQERTQVQTQCYVQQILMDQAEMHGRSEYPLLIEASASPDLRRVVLFWESARKNAIDQKVAQRKLKAMERQLTQMESFIRGKTATFLNLKYAPVIEFRRAETAKNDIRFRKKLMMQEEAPQKTADI